MQDAWFKAAPRQPQRQDRNPLLVPTRAFGLTKRVMALSV